MTLRSLANRNSILHLRPFHLVGAFLLGTLVLIFALDDAEARRRRHYYRSYVIDLPAEVGAAPNFDASPRRRGRSSRNGRHPTIASLVPQNWQAEPQNPNWNGKRFLSPDGASWLAVYRTPTQNEPVAEHMRDLIFVNDEVITYLRGERTWVAVSGFKDSRVFYRKAILACAGKAWHHIAFEYPAEMKDNMEPLVSSAARALDNTQADCEQMSATGPELPGPPHARQ